MPIFKNHSQAQSYLAEHWLSLLVFIAPHEGERGVLYIERDTEKNSWITMEQLTNHLEPGSNRDLILEMVAAYPLKEQWIIAVGLSDGYHTTRVRLQNDAPAFVNVIPSPNFQITDEQRDTMATFLDHLTTVFWQRVRKAITTSEESVISNAQMAEIVHEVVSEIKGINPAGTLRDFLTGYLIDVINEADRRRAEAQ